VEFGVVDGLQEVQVKVHLEERQQVAALLASKAAPQAMVLVNGEAGARVIVQWTMTVPLPGALTKVDAECLERLDDVQFTDGIDPTLVVGFDVATGRASDTLHPLDPLHLTQYEGQSFPLVSDGVVNDVQRQARVTSLLVSVKEQERRHPVLVFGQEIFLPRHSLDSVEP
jgi:hypothetical protein